MHSRLPKVTAIVMSSDIPSTFSMKSLLGNVPISWSQRKSPMDDVVRPQGEQPSVSFVGHEGGASVAVGILNAPHTSIIL